MENEKLQHLLELEKCCSLIYRFALVTRNLNKQMGSSPTFSFELPLVNMAQNKNYWHMRAREYSKIGSLTLEAGKSKCPNRTVNYSKDHLSLQLKFLKKFSL